MKSIRFLFFLVLVTVSCASKDNNSSSSSKPKTANLKTNEYLPIIKGKKIAVCANNSSYLGKRHLVDSLLDLNFQIKYIFSPEHGFKGDAGAGEYVKDGKYSRGQIPIISLYGKNKKPSNQIISNVDIIIFDIQDVGVRFYTYISTMHFLMEACAEADKTLLILDRPNPNGFFVDGPVLRSEYKSFVGMHKVPIVHGMTIAEYARMINGEGWLKDGKVCDLKIIKCDNYTHSSLFELERYPSPNLQSQKSIYLYPTLALFEGTDVSIGRGTEFPFLVIGHPEFKSDFYFIPKSMPGAAPNPKHMGEKCFGLNLKNYSSDSLTENPGIRVELLIRAYQMHPDKENFFNSFFYKLSGNKELKHQLESGVSAQQIRESWHDDIDDFMLTRKKYLLYRDFK